MDTLAPKLSIAFFAYNQEKYVRESVRSVLAQECEQAVEIVLSDDCSQDTTYSIMQEVVQAYSGTHKVILRQNERNLGLANHINLVFSMCHGDWIMCAAGDDISLPTRAQSLVDLLITHNDTNIMAVQGGYSEIDPEGRLTGEFPDPDLPTSDLVKYVNTDGYVVGATMSYRKFLVNSFPPLGEDVGFEDRVYGFRALLLGEIVNLAQPLVLYRRDVPTSLTTGDRRVYDHAKSIRVLARKYSGLKHVALQYLRDLDHLGETRVDLRGAIQGKIHEYRFKEAVFMGHPCLALHYGVCGFLGQQGLSAMLMGVARACYYRLRSFKQ